MGCFRMNGPYRLCIICTKKEISIYQTVIGASCFFVYGARCNALSWLHVLLTGSGTPVKSRLVSERIIVPLTIFLHGYKKQSSNHSKLYVAFMDFGKAFEIVCKHKLWNILHKNELSGKIINALNSMYEVVKSKARAGGDLTEVFMCHQGLTQGEVCSPVLLFVCFYKWID